MTSKLVTLSAVLGLFVVATAAQAGSIKTGEWQYTTETHMPGMPQIHLPPGVHLPPGMHLPTQTPGGGMRSTHTSCVTDPNPTPPQPRSHQQCHVDRMERHGNRINWAATCTTPEGPMRGEGTAVYTSSSMDSTMTVHGMREGQPFELTTHTTGHWVGPCHS